MATKKSLLHDYLTKLLTTPDIPCELDDAILDHVLSIQTEDAFDDFMSGIVDQENDTHLELCDQIRHLLFKIKTEESSATDISKPSGSRAKAYKNPKNKFKKKKNFQDIETYEEKKEIEKGRQQCNCYGQRHGFMSNCLNCGRIHCVKEGLGPCFFCGASVSTFASKSSYATDCDASQLDTIDSNDLANTFKPKKNIIYDDDNDYFKTKVDTGSRSKKAMVVALDLATRTVIESTEEDERLRKKILENCMIHLKNVEQMYKNLQKSSEFKPITNLYDEMVDLLIKMRHVKINKVEPDLTKEDGKMPDATFENNDNFDQGLCLSMHQPYASLLIAGVKKHEGRNWPTNHRGTLWIAAAAHIPDAEEIAQIEEFYREYYNDSSLKFPASYPRSCLLGSVQVEDCLSQEIYRKTYPQGESNSPYVLICSNPVILPIFYPIVGQHKIYPLDKDLHKCVKMCMRFAKFANED